MGSSDKLKFMKLDRTGSIAQSAEQVQKSKQSKKKTNIRDV